MIRTVLIIALIFIVPILSFMSCCLGYVEPDYYVKEYNFMTAAYTYKSDDLTSVTELEPNASCRYTEYGILVKPNIEKMACHMTGFGSVAYACTPEPGEVDRIIKVEIIANRDYDALHKAGNDVSDLFRFNTNSSISRLELSETEYIYMGERFDQILFTLHNPPAVEGEYSFTIKLMIDGHQINHAES